MEHRNTVQLGMLPKSTHCNLQGLDLMFALCGSILNVQLVFPVCTRLQRRLRQVHVYLLAQQALQPKCVTQVCNP